MEFFNVEDRGQDATEKYAYLYLLKHETKEGRNKGKEPRSEEADN